MPMPPLKALQLVLNNGPRYYFETDSATGTGAHLDHPLWTLPAARFMVHLDVRGLTPDGCAAALIANVEPFKASFQSANPGVPFPGYGVRLAALGGWYAYEDFAGLNPILTSHPDDALNGYVNGFNFSRTLDPAHGFFGFPGAAAGGGLATKFVMASGAMYNRPAGGLVGNTIEFDTGTALQGERSKVTAWASHELTVAPAFTAAPSSGDAFHIFSDFPPEACYRFGNGRADLGSWSDAFFDKLDSIWPTGLEQPELISCTTENLSEASVAWFGSSPPLAAYIALGSTEPVTDSATLNQWISAYGTNLTGGTIITAGPAGVAARSPQAQDVRSLAQGAYSVGVAWSWQVCFVDRMKRTFPRTKFLQYLLRAASKRSPVHTQPGEVFYHGDPWPKDVAHSPDYYYTILNCFTAAVRYPGTVDTGSSTTQFSVSGGTPFVSISTWGPSSPTSRLRFDTTTSTVSLRKVGADITSWNPTTKVLQCSTLPATPATGDTFAGYFETPQYTEFVDTSSVGWAVWAAFKDLYGHTGTDEEVYRKTCISWVNQTMGELAESWRERDIIPYLARAAETDGPQTIEDTVRYPEASLQVSAGMQTRADWTGMLSHMIDLGTGRSIVFETHEEETDVLDAWAEILSGARSHFNDRRQAIEQTAPHHRNREWRKRHLWRW